MLTAHRAVGVGRTGEAMQGTEKAERKGEDEGAGRLLRKGACFCLLRTTPRKSLWVLGDGEQ